MRQIIDIRKYLPETITSRKAIDVLKSYSSITESYSYVFDFSNVDFISRAFADELMHFIEKKNISVKFINTNYNVAQMLDAVNRNRSKRNSSFHKIAITHFIGKEELNKFLSVI